MVRPVSGAASDVWRPPFLLFPPTLFVSRSAQASDLTESLLPPERARPLSLIVRPGIDRPSSLMPRRTTHTDGTAFLARILTSEPCFLQAIGVSRTRCCCFLFPLPPIHNGLPCRDLFRIDSGSFRSAVELRFWTFSLFYVSFLMSLNKRG